MTANTPWAPPRPHPPASCDTVTHAESARDIKGHARWMHLLQGRGAPDEGMAKPQEDRRPFWRCHSTCSHLSSAGETLAAPYTKGVSLLKESTRRGSPTYWLYLCIIIIINRLLGENKPVNSIYILEKKKIQNTEPIVIKNMHGDLECTNLDLSLIWIT